MRLENPQEYLALTFITTVASAACEGELSFPLLAAARQTTPSAGVHASETCSPKGAHTTSGGISVRTP